MKSEEIDNEGIEVHLNLSTCYVEIGDYEQALSEASKALKINPSDSDALYNTRKILIIMKNYEKAFSVLRDKYTSVHNDIGLLKNLFISALKTNNYDVCIETAKKILTIDENDETSKKFLSDELKS